MNANALSTNLIVTGIVLLMVFALPWLDRKLCKKLGMRQEGFFREFMSFVNEPDGTPPRYDRRIAIHLAMCHILSMGLWGDGQNGALTNASQGSVSTAFNLIQGKTTTESFWMQTPCGQRYWMMLKPYIMGGRVYISRGFHPWG